MAKKFLEDMIQIKNENRLKRDTKSTLVLDMNKKDNLKISKKEENIQNSMPNPAPKESTPKSVNKTAINMKNSISNSKVYYDRDGYREVVNDTKGNNSYFLWILVILVIIFSFFSISSKFSKASVVVDPKIEKFSIDEPMKATKDLSQSESKIGYQLIIVDGTQSKIVEAKGEKEVKIKAIGNIVIYNAFSTTPQKLNIDTRLLGSNGKIYKTKEAVTIPAMSGADFGSVEVEIYAEKEGSEYNSGPLDFQILGFKGTSKYEKIYARSKGEIAGGFNGLQKIVDDETFKQAQEEVNNALELRLLEKALDQIPKDYILFKDATFYDIKASITNNNTSSNEAEITATGVLYGFIFKKDNLENNILNQEFQDKDITNLYISNLKDLTFEITNKEINPNQVSEISFYLKGEVNAPYKINEQNLKQSLLGKAKKDFANIMSSNPNVENAELSLKPIWQNKIPKEIKRINLKINYP